VETSGRKSKTIYSEARKVINHTNHPQKQENCEKSLILPIQCAG